MRAFFLTVIFLTGPGLASAQALDRCDVAAFVTDPNSGVNVRADAGRKFGIVTTIPRDSRGTLVFISGSKDDWLMISRAVNSKKTTVFSGVGWVHAPLVSVKSSAAGDDLVLYYRRPRTETEAMGVVRSGLEVTVLGCSGDWIKILIPVRGTEGTPAWLPHGSYCGSPWEDCS